MRRALARILRVVADEIFYEEPEEGVRVFADVPEHMLTPMLEALNKAVQTRSWPCRSCGGLVSVSPEFVLSADAAKWAQCALCSEGNYQSSRHDF